MSGFKPRTGFILFFILVFGFMLRLDNLSGRSLWTDEFFTLFQSSGHGLDVRAFDDSIAAMDTPPLLKPSDLRLFIGKDPGKGVRDVTTGLLKTDTHPPLYFWVVHAWMIMFGDSVFALRFFSLLLGVLSIFLAYKLGGRLFGRQAGIFCSLFTALSPFSIRYSQEARAYSLIMAIGLVSSLLLLRIERDNRNSDAFYFSLATAIGLYTHYFYAFLALAQFFYFSVAHFRDDRRLRKFYLSALGALLLFSPWLAYLFLNGYNFPDAEWIFGYPGIIGKISGIFPGMMGYFLVPGGTGLPWVLFVLSGSLSFVYIVIRELRDVFSGYRRQIFFCLSVLVMPLLIMLLLDIFYLIVILFIK